MAESVLDIVKQEFNQWSWLFNHPEIGPLLRKAVDPNEGFSPSTFKAKIMNTRWWKSQSAAQRNWQMQIHNDPASAQAARNLGMRQINETAQRLGIGLSLKQQAFLSEIMNQKGLAPNDPAIMNALIRIYRTSPKQRQAGAVATARESFRNAARNEYFVPYGQKDQYDWGLAIATGRKSEEDMRTFLAQRAASRYSHLSAELATGKTMRELFDGHIQTIAEQLELDPDDIDLTRGPWMKVIDTVDTKTGKHRSLSLGETQTLARRDSRFWKTKAGKAEEAQFTNFMLKSFGRRA